MLVTNIESMNDRDHQLTYVYQIEEREVSDNRTKYKQAISLLFFTFIDCSISYKKALSFQPLKRVQIDRRDFDRF